MTEQYGMQGPLKGVGFQPQVDPAYRAAVSKRHSTLSRCQSVSGFIQGIRLE